MKNPSGNRLTKPPLPACLPGFEHVNRFWDNQRKTYVAKILPGEFYVTRGNESVATTLGSCVSACIRDRKIGIGGMNHFMLPLTAQESDKVRWGNEVSDATRYGNYAMEHLINEIIKHGGIRKNLEAKVFGGGKILRQANDIGTKNADFVIDYLATENIPIIASDLKDTVPRKVIYTPVTGQAFIKQLQSLHNDTIATREKDYRDTIEHKPVEGDIELF